MKIKAGQEQAYADWKAKNSTCGYGLACFTFAERWAESMERHINETTASPAETIALVAERTSHEADTEGITGFMYGMSVQILALCWEHGEVLRRWHNLYTQIGTEGEKANTSGGVLNPALLRIG